MKKQKKYLGNFDDASMSSFFHENTKCHTLERTEGTSQKLFNSSFVHYKSYPRFKKTLLPKIFSKEEVSIQEVIIKERPMMEFARKSFSLEEISKILFYSAGITHTEKMDEKELSHRAYPSIGSRYPLELYPVLFQDNEIEPGIYHYNVKSHTLELILTGDYRNQIIYSTKNQEWIKNASLAILISAIFKRTEMEFGDRGYRYVLLEAGHLAQNLFLITASMSLTCDTIGEFLDDELNKLLDLDGTNEAIIYIMVIGGKSRSLVTKIRDLFLFHRRPPP